MSVYKITCLIEEEPAVLFPLLLPMQFKLSKNNSITWQNEKTSFEITPFTSRGRGVFGYHITFIGNPESCRYLMDQFLSPFKPLISGIEWIHQSIKTQSDLIRLSEQHRFLKCSHRGLYEKNGVGVVLLPNAEIHLQIRCRKISVSNLPNILLEITDIASVYQEKPVDLFSFNEELCEVFS